MIIIIVLRAMLWRVPRPIERSAPVAPVRLRRLPLGVHVWGAFLPPWPNYGVSRVRSVRRRRSKR